MTDLPTAWELQETVYSRNREIAELDNEIKSMATTIAALRAEVEANQHAYALIEEERQRLHNELGLVRDALVQWRVAQSGELGESEAERFQRVRGPEIELNVLADEILAAREKGDK